MQVTFYESLRDFSEYGKQRWLPKTNVQVNNSIEGLLLGGLAGGKSFLELFNITPMKHHIF